MRINNINRRAFITGLVSIPAYALAIGKMPLIGRTKYPRMLLVSARHDTAVEIHTAMGSPRNVTPCWMGSALCGIMIDLIVTDEIEPGTAREKSWWNSAVLTRLAPDGQHIRFVTSDAIPADYGAQTVLPSTCHTREGVLSCRTLFHKRPELITHADHMHAKALQIMYFAKARGFEFQYTSKRSS